MKLHEELRQGLVRTRAAPSTLQLLEHLFINPATTVSTAAQNP
jgi:hypothetical protein